MKILSIIITLLISVTITHAQTLEGTISRVIDADTIILGEQRIRLCGIEAPEPHEEGGERAKAFLEGLTESRKLSCRIVGSGTPCDGRSRRTSFNRLVAQCLLNDENNNEDIAKILVRRGHAVDAPKYSGGYYNQTD